MAWVTAIYLACLSAAAALSLLLMAICSSVMAIGEAAASRSESHARS
jgi:hypothetical protein